MNTIRNYPRFLTVAGALPHPYRSNGEYIDDTAITTKVKAELLKDPVVSCPSNVRPSRVRCS
jgi:hypothetical protein